jgi:hypothetical protein
VLGNYKKAHDAFTDALRINPDNAEAMLGLQKILDPDGVDGVITGSQAEGSNPVMADVERRDRSD